VTKRYQTQRIDTSALAVPEQVSVAMERMLAGLSTRRYGAGLEPVGQGVTVSATATSRSAVSRKFVAMTETALEDMLAADLSGLDLVAFFTLMAGEGESPSHPVPRRCSDSVPVDVTEHRGRCQSSGSSAKVRLVSLYQPIDF